MGGYNLIATEHGTHGRYGLSYEEGCGVSSAECLVDM